MSVTQKMGERWPFSKVSQIFIDRSIADLPEVLSIRSRLKTDLPVTTIETALDVYEKLKAASDPIGKGKQILYLTQNKGTFIRQCPGTQTYTCCGYMILHIASYCVMDCAYCILQTYFHPPLLTFFVNHDRMFQELDHMFETKTIRRIGTGEFTDSMIWESWTDISARLVTRFGEQHYTALELKTKTTAVDRLKALSHNGKTIMAWSLNTPRIIQSEEKGTASLASRLKAASQCESWGYPLAFHFDPLVIYEGCESEYKSVLEQLFSAVLAERIVWISLGTFRFMPALKSVIQERFPNSTIAYGEFIPGLDGKMRYFKPLRMRLYGKMIGWIRERAPQTCIYFCMEDEEVWRKCMGFDPAERGGLERMLDDAAIYHCRLK